MMARQLWKYNYTYSLSVIILISLIPGFEQKHFTIWTDISNMTYLDGLIRRTCAKVHNKACTDSIYYYPATNLHIEEVNIIYRYHQGNTYNVCCQ